MRIPQRILRTAVPRTAVLTAFLTAALLLTALPACSPRPVRYEATDLTLFDTVTTVVGYAESRADFDAVAEEIFAELAVYHQLYDVYREYPGVVNLKTVNDAAGEAPVPVDTRILDLLDFARQACEQTNGTVNATLGALLSVWHNFREQVQAGEEVSLPDAEALQAAAVNADWSCVEITRSAPDSSAAGTVRITDPSLSLDVGAMAKGYAVEQVAQRLEAEGLTGYVINAGGNLRAIGSQPDGTPWPAGVQNPDLTAEEQVVFTLPLDGQACVTSGAYQRYVEYGGQRYGHIVDPATGCPASIWASVTVRTRHSGWADVLSTALFCLPQEEGQALLDAYETVSGEPADALWLLPDGSARLSPGLSALDPSTD